MPPIKSSTFKRYILLAASIFLNRKIISPYSYYIKKGLVYIIIINFFSCQLFSCTKCTKLNTCMLYNVRSVSFNKYTFLYYIHYYTY